MPNDFQRQRVYDWEHSLDSTIFRNQKKFTFDEIETYVKHVWMEMGLKYPPLVIPFPKQVKTIVGDALRNEIRFHEGEGRITKQRTVLHELSHAMLADIDGNSHWHNEYFVGLQMELLIKFMKADRFYLWFSAEKAGIKFIKFAKPQITDEGHFYK